MVGFSRKGGLRFREDDRCEALVKGTVTVPQERGDALFATRVPYCARRSLRCGIELYMVDGLSGIGSR
jgi:hypothetical protein